MHFSICKSETCIIYDVFICFFRNPICNLDRDVWTFSWIWLFRSGSSFLFSFMIYFLCFKIIFYLKLDSDFNNSGLFVIICATYRMDLVHMFHEFLVEPALLRIAKIPFCYLSFASSFPGFQGPVTIVQNLQEN